jgi:AraC-like DNA-binding protein
MDHVIHSHALVLMLRGEGRLRMERMEIPAIRPLLWYAPPNTRAREHFPNGGDSWYTCFEWPGMSIRPDGAQRLEFSCRQHMLRAPRWKAIDAVTTTRAVELFSRMRTASAHQTFTGQLHCSALLLELFCIYADLPSGDDVSVGHRALVRFQHLLQEHACDDTSIDTLAEQSGASADYLRNLFQRRIGERPVEFRNGLRLARARDLLVSTDMNIKEAARRAGFADPLYFSRVFRKRFGISPREMIRRYRMGNSAAADGIGS